MSTEKKTDGKTAAAEKPKKELGPTAHGEQKDADGNQVWVSAQKRLTFYADIALRMMVKHEVVQLHGLGAAISSAVEVSQYLITSGKATLQKLITSTVHTPTSRKPEVVISLKRTAIPELPSDEEQAYERVVEDDDHPGRNEE